MRYEVFEVPKHMRGEMNWICRVYGDDNQLRARAALGTTPVDAVDNAVRMYATAVAVKPAPIPQCGPDCSEAHTHGPNCIDFGPERQRLRAHRLPDLGDVGL